MKKHNFNESIEIFREIFKGWSVVDKAGNKHELRSLDLIDRSPKGCVFNIIENHQISHLEQTMPMNGDGVWAWDDDPSKKEKFIYIGKTTGRLHACLDEMSLVKIWGNVELISPTRKLTIDEATELLKSVINEPFEIQQ